MAHRSREARNAYAREWYRVNAERHKALTKYRRDQQYAECRARICAAKSKPCADCGVLYPYYVMDFDHVRGEKLANVSSMATGRFKVSDIDAEIAKCDVVCANCHRVRTYTRMCG